jgi:hypothetical protein
MPITKSSSSPPHVRDFSLLYDRYGLGAAKNFWLLVNLVTLRKSVNLCQLKDCVGGLLEKVNTTPDSHYRRLTRFFWTGGATKPFCTI